MGFPGGRVLSACLRVLISQNPPKKFKTRVLSACLRVLSKTPKPHARVLSACLRVLSVLNPPKLP